MSSKLEIRLGSINEAVEASRKIPEFKSPYEAEDYRLRLQKPSLILVALVDEELAGFKVGYDRRTAPQEFYSWMGGILPQFRELGIASKLAEAQEVWALEKGYTSIIFKTRNSHRAMLQFAISRDFNFVSVEEHDKIEDNRIWMRKSIR